MSLSLDTAAIRDRFVTAWDDTQVLTLFANSTATKPDPKKPFVRFTISPGSKELVGGDGVYERLGRVILQIFVPEGQGSAVGMEIADRFETVFLNWMSPDRCVRSHGAGEITTVPNGENGLLQINVSIRWSSLRGL